MLPLKDLDNPVWILISGGFITLVAAISLFCNYCQWETPKDLATISAIAVAYFVSAVTKRIARVKQRQKREHPDA